MYSGDVLRTQHESSNRYARSRLDTLELQCRPSEVACHAMLYRNHALAYLTGRVNDFRREILTFVLYDARKSVLNRRIVTFDKVPFDKLHRE